MKVGIVGCGTISGIYLTNLKSRFSNVQVTAAADLVPERARAKAAEHGIPRACSVEELLADPGVECVLNLTVPQAHAEVTLAAIAAGKHVYTEKPLAISLRDAEKILTLAGKKRVRVGAAPDTFLGSGIQTCVSLIDEGAIGVPVAAAAFMVNHGHESWHPDPAFYYTQGGGPVFDMGPYYFTALLALLDRPRGCAAPSSGHSPGGSWAPGRRPGRSSRWTCPRTPREPSISRSARWRRS